MLITQMVVHDIILLLEGGVAPKQEPMRGRTFSKNIFPRISCMVNGDTTNE